MSTQPSDSTGPETGMMSSDTRRFVLDTDAQVARLERKILQLWAGLGAILLLVVGLYIPVLVTASQRSSVQIQQQPAPKNTATVNPSANQPDPKRASYLDELEKLDALRLKGVLTPQEFEAKKQALLTAAPEKPNKRSDMDELDRQIRAVWSLRQKNIIGAFEFENKKQEYLKAPLTCGDLEKDLEKAHQLRQENIIGAFDFEELKKRLLHGNKGGNKN